MENKTLWYAIMADRDDTDWGTGTFDRDEAVRRMHELNDGYEAEGLERDAYVAVIDAGYQYEEGEGFVPTCDAICVDEITE